MTHSSFDWLISIGPLPLSFALTGPVASMIGARATLMGAAIAGGGITLAALFLPGMRAIEHAASQADADVRVLSSGEAPVANA